METLIVQTGGGPGRVRELVNHNGEAIGIGRGFGNHVILTDPYIAPDQASFQCEGGVWYFQNLDNTNRVLLNNEILPAQRVKLQTGDRLVLGRTEIRIFSPDHEVAPTRKLLLSGWLHYDSIGFMVPFLAIIVCNLMDFGMDHLLDATREVEWKDSITNLLWLNIILLVWSGAWAITGKLVRHHYHFGQQIFITTIGLIGMIILLPVLDYIEFATNTAMLSTIVTILVMLMVVAWLVKFNLYFSTSGRHATAVGIIVSMVIVGGVSTINYLSQDDFDPNAQNKSELYPGFTRFGSGESVDSYFDQVEAMLGSVEQ
jgi:hypothetical protein